MASYRVFSQTKRPVDAFRALYYWAVSGANYDMPGEYAALWTVLPKDDYEVARLHFIVSSRDAMLALTGLGERLLAKNPKDAEVLYIQAYLQLPLQRTSNLAKADRYATAALRLKPGPATYLRYGMAKTYLAKEKRNAKAGREARIYIDKYMATANPKDTWWLRQAKGYRDWLTQNGY